MALWHLAGRADCSLWRGRRAGRVLRQGECNAEIWQWSARLCSTARQPSVTSGSRHRGGGISVGRRPAEHEPARVRSRVCAE